MTECGIYINSGHRKDCIGANFGLLTHVMYTRKILAGIPPLVGEWELAIVSTTKRELHFHYIGSPLDYNPSRNYVQKTIQILNFNIYGHN
jgi:hypothetical protein